MSIVQSVPEPKFSHGQEIVATAERYGPACPVETAAGRITEIRFILYEFDQFIGKWEYEIDFGFPTNADDLAFHRPAIFDEAAIVEGLKYRHHCTHNARSN